MDQGFVPKNGGGSVRRARERMQAGMRTERPDGSDEGDMIPIMPPPQYAYPRPPANRANNTSQPRKVPAALIASRGNPVAIGAAISKPEPTPQWPLREDLGSLGAPRSPAGGRVGLPKGPAPRRPPRPSNVPSLLDSSRVHDYTPGFPSKQQSPQSPDNWDRDNGHLSVPSRSTTISSSDRESTSSSVGTIPDFPIPATPTPAPPAALAPPRRNPGSAPAPPPLSRRGASSYYSQISYVSPIPEEFPESMRGGGSIASSTAIPSSWGSEPADFDLGIFGGELSPQAYASPDGDETETEHDRSSSGSMHSDATSLVRHASVGKRGKPSLTTIGPMEDPRPAQNPKPSLNSPSSSNSSLAVIGQAIGTRNNSPKPGFANRSLFLDSPSRTSSPITPSPLSSEVQLGNIPIAMETQPRSRSPLNSPTDPQGGPILGSLERGFLSRKPSMSDRISQQRRPPRLNLQAVREAEARGSMTSLPDLIRRATKLASNLDRGRTASRIGSMHMYQSSKDVSTSQEATTTDRRSGSISDILASFPPPGLATPTNERPPSRWPSPFSQSQWQSVADSDPRNAGEKQPRKRRCCGMPLWAFLVLLLVFILVVAAAIIIPVVLIVIPQQNQNNTNTSDAVSSCVSSTTCQNGGVAVVNGSACQCICVNGFTGANCNTAADASCTTFDVEDGEAVKNATLGNALPRLFDASEANFSVPLNSSRILRLFSTNNLSCTSENALVSFDGASSKKRFALANLSLEEPERPVSVARDLSFTPTRVQRDEDLVERDPANPVGTSHGIVYAVNTAATSSAAYYSSTATSSAAAAAATTTVTAISSKTLDFARIAVLFILEETKDLQEAVNAQESIQSFFQGQQDATDSNSTMSMETFLLNFSNFTISLENGTVVGGG